MAATAPSPQQIADAISAAWLQRAREYDNVIQTGTVPSGSAGGGNATFVFNRDVPEAPAWAESVILEFTLPITLSLPAGTAATVSPYAPYSAVQRQLILGGSPAFPFVSGVPFWLDEITSRRNYDSSLSVPGSLPAVWADSGPGAFALGAFTPGSVVSNSSTAATTTNVTLSWRERIQLGRNLYGRRAPNLIGCIPLGDPDHRPVLNLNLGNLVGTHPEDTLFVSAGAGVTAATNGAGSVTVIWEALALDIIPLGMPQPPAPTVAMALAVESNGGQSIQNSGQIQQVAHRTAQIYLKTFHAVVNNQQPIDPDYMALWLTGEQTSARYEYDSNLGNLGAYYSRIHARYGRFLPTGLFVADFVGGKFPELPKETPYEGAMSPDVTYAGMAGVAPTPSMYTAVRVPSGTTMAGAYVKTYSLGLVRVSY